MDGWIEVFARRKINCKRVYSFIDICRYVFPEEY